MILDSLNFFTGGTASPGNSDGKTDIPTTGAQTSSVIIDLGVGSPTNPAIPSDAAGGGARDIGVGDDPAIKCFVNVTTAFAAGTSLQISLQGAPDSGSGTPGAFTTMITGPVVALANLVVGARLLEVDVPRPAPGQVLPRYLQLAYTIVGTFSGGGAIEGALVPDRLDQPGSQTGILSGYAPGVVVPN